MASSLCSNFEMRRRSLLALIGLALVGAGPLAGCSQGGMFDFRDHGVGFGKRQPVADESFTDPAMVRAADAIKADNAVLLRDLVAAGTDVNGRGVDGVTLLDWVLRYGSLKTLGTLLGLGAKPDAPGWHDRLASHELAPDAGRSEWLAAVLNAGASVNSLASRTGVPLLAVATKRDNDVNLAELLRRRPELDLADPNGSTALHSGARVNAGKQLLTLLRAGADPRLETSSGDTFQPYYFGTPIDALNDVSRAERRAVRGWLVAHGVPLDPSAR